VTYRDLGSHPLPHFDAVTGLARLVPPELRTPAQAASWALTEELIGEIREADTILLGLPLYNFGAPSSVKAWVDHLIAPQSREVKDRAGLSRGYRGVAC
jgi:FMN-dependent NADH-azoreductase